MGNIAGGVIIGFFIFAFVCSLAADRWTCESTGYYVVGRSLGPHEGTVSFLNMTLGITPVLAFPADKCRRAP